MRGLAHLALLAAVALVAASAQPASATKFRKPFNGNVNLGHGFDNNYGAAGCTDYACAGKCYDGHGGSDFPMVTGTEVVAGAGGTVSTVVQGCANTGYRGNPCGSFCGNYVKIAHPDGSSTIYCHMKNGSIVVGQGQGVSCGQKLGLSASSGSSTGPHLHFGWKPGGVNTDPYSGGCSGGGGAWVSQGPYNGAPGTACEVQCQCTAGQQQTQACGNCGTRTRTCNASCKWGGWTGCQGQGACAPGQDQTQACGNCGSQSRSCKSNCQWAGWSGCSGQGPCSPGTVEEEACCDCGARARTCAGDCSWPDWSVCDGPDPEPEVACATGQLGVCGVGEVHCLTGCLTCVQTWSPSDEVCDDLDNDCDGPVDEEAVELGDPGPAFGAEVVDLSAPTALRPGEHAMVWLVVRNVGTEVWLPHETWVGTHADDEGPSPLWDPGAWSAHDVAAVLDHPVAPGETASLTFPVRMPHDAESTVTSRFQITARGEALRCPAPGFEVSATRLAPGPAAAVAAVAVPPARSPHEPADTWGAGPDDLGPERRVAEAGGPTVGPAATSTETGSRSVTAGCSGGPAAPGWPLVAGLLVWLGGLARSRARC